MTYSIVQKSHLEGATRLDAEYYQPEYLMFAKDLDALGGVPLGELAFITDGQHGYHVVDPASEIRHLTAKNITNWLVHDDGADRLASETHERNPRSALIKDDVLISTAGTIGEAGIVTKEVLPANIDQDVARVHITDQRLNPYFLVAFLHSKYGQFQIERQTTGQIQTHLALEKVKREIRVPLPTWQGVIAAAVHQAIDHFAESKTLFGKAEELLLGELGLPAGGFQDDLTFSIKLSDVNHAHRFDAEHFQTKYERLIAQTKKRNPAKLGDLVSMRKGFEPGSEAYQEEGKLFIRVSSVSRGGLNDRDQKYLSDEMFEELKQEFAPKVGEILLTKDASPGIACVLKEPVEGVVSGGVLRLKLKDKQVDSEYLALCLNSVIGQLLAERDAGGSVIAHWKPAQIRELLIPVLSTERQREIGDLVRQSQEARRKGKQLLDEAKRKVEEYIERQ